MEFIVKTTSDFLNTVKHAKNKQLARFPLTVDESVCQFFVFFFSCIMFKTGKQGTAESNTEVSDVTMLVTE